jgi:hypothetical protein
MFQGYIFFLKVKRKKENAKKMKVQNPGAKKCKKGCVRRKFRLSTGGAKKSASEGGEGEYGF